ncbi:unnamed protein product, partial [Eretmochelys imbricata]
MVQYQGEEPLGYLQWCLGEIFRERLLLTLSCVLRFHIIQVISGCDLREVNVIQGFYQDSYDGRDFLTLVKETMTWVAANIGAEITKRRWDVEVLDNQQWKRYLEEKCIPWLRSALEYGKKTLQRKEPNNNLFPVLAGVITAVFLIGVIIRVVVWKKKRP